MSKALKCLAVAVWASTTGCGEDSSLGTDSPQDLIGPLSLSEVTLWAYQIQDLDAPGAVEELAASHYDLLVLEPTRTDWSSDSRFFDTREMVEKLKSSPASDDVHRKLVLAYIDIGEAEDWRWYWTWSKSWPLGTARPDDWPAYIVRRDPDGWEGNYPVAYWQADWKDIVIYGQNQPRRADRNYASILDEVISDGFDGIYLDWVEAFEDEEVVQVATEAGKDAAEEMIGFIAEMRAYAEERVPDFLIIQQNAASLADGHPELFEQIDAIAQEAVWYDGDATDDWVDESGVDYVNDADLIGYYTDFLELYQEAGVPVFNCEYALNHATTAYSRSYERGYVPYVSRRALNALTTTPPPEY